MELYRTCLPDRGLGFRLTTRESDCPFSARQPRGPQNPKADLSLPSWQHRSYDSFPDSTAFAARPCPGSPRHTSPWLFRKHGGPSARHLLSLHQEHTLPAHQGFAQLGCRKGGPLRLRVPQARAARRPEAAVPEASPRFETRGHGQGGACPPRCAGRRGRSDHGGRGAESLAWPGRRHCQLQPSAPSMPAHILAPTCSPVQTWKRTPPPTQGHRLDRAALCT